MHTIMHEEWMVEQVIINSTWQKSYQHQIYNVCAHRSFGMQLALKLKSSESQASPMFIKDSSFILDSANLYSDEAVA